MTETTTGIPGKGGYTQTVQPMFSENPYSSYSDIDTGSGYYRNPYASGYGMGYQDPYGSARFMPAMGLMGPSNYSPYRGGKGGYASQPVYAPYGYSPYGGMSPGKGGYSSAEYGGVPPGTTPTGPGYSEPIMAGDAEMYASPVESIVGADGGSPYYVDTPVDDPAVETVTPVDPVVDTSPDVPVEAPVYMDAADADPTQTIQGAAIAADGSNVVDFTPYTGDEFVRIGDQVVSRAELQRRGSDYYTRPVYNPMAAQYRNQMFPVSVPGKGGYYR